MSHAAVILPPTTRMVAVMLSVLHMEMNHGSACLHIVRDAMTKAICNLRETCEVAAKMLGADGTIKAKELCSHSTPHKHVRACDNDICKYYAGVEIPEVKCE